MSLAGLVTFPMYDKKCLTYFISFGISRSSFVIGIELNYVLGDQKLCKSSLFGIIVCLDSACMRRWRKLGLINLARLDGNSSFDSNSIWQISITFFLRFSIDFSCGGLRMGVGVKRAICVGGGGEGAFSWGAKSCYI